MRILEHSWWDFKIVQPRWNTVWPFLIELNIHLSYDQVILLDTYPREMKIHITQNNYKRMFIAASLIIDKNWKTSHMTYNRKLDKQSDGIVTP